MRDIFTFLSARLVSFQIPTGVVSGGGGSGTLADGEQSARQEEQEEEGTCNCRALSEAGGRHLLGCCNAAWH